jgi:hypothetical protein
LSPSLTLVVVAETAPPNRRLGAPSPRALDLTWILATAEEVVWLTVLAAAVLVDVVRLFLLVGAVGMGAHCGHGGVGHYVEVEKLRSGERHGGANGRRDER